MLVCVLMLSPLLVSLIGPYIRKPLLLVVKEERHIMRYYEYIIYILIWSKLCPDVCQFQRS